MVMKPSTRPSARRRFGALVLTLIAAVPATVSATPVVRHYDIHGNTERALTRQLQTKGPVASTGKRFDALTRWHVTWNFRYEPRGGSCVITRVNTRTEATITLPRWRNQAGAPPSLVRQWNRYITALTRHEHNHVAHATTAAREIERLGRGFSQRGNCSGIERAFNRQADILVQRAQERDRSYDRRTGHGRTEGAHFP